MNLAVLSGHLTAAPQVRYSQTGTAVANYCIAVDYSKDETAFINCIAFERNAEFAEKYFKKGSRIEIAGKIRTGSYTAREGHKVYFTEVVVSQQGFAESKADAERRQQNEAAAPENGTSAAIGDGFMNIPDGTSEELPFN